jgi:transcriptional regulator with XRE-family HTH domain
MPTERLSMRHIREVLRLHYSVGMSQRAVARSLGLAQGTVSKYLNRTRRAGLTWPLPPELDDDVRLENRLYPPPSDRPSDERPQPDWALVHRELRRPNVTLMLLWEEYCDASSDGFSYSWFCERYKEWAGRLKPTLRQVHVAGEKLFVDYSGQTMEVVDGLTGEVRSTQIFVAVLGASNYTYAEASLSQSLPDWIASHVRAFSFFGGVARQTVSDNLKAGPAFTSRWSTGPMPISPAITAPPSFRHGHIGRGTKPRSKSGSKSSGDGFWRVCATAASSRSPPSTRQFTRSLSS